MKTPQQQNGYKCYAKPKRKTKKRNERTDGDKNASVRDDSATLDQR